ncbi:MAG: carboxy-S-adenosyl-L-methionine synthase CmoA [Gammaproteobacteria bacterium]|nr:carboxy-S-adenosyl-L-methionine synthase CmoA [Gammaproteobacteria bacterium]MDP2139551.1 carboxy-S-adenosyl-L-methionine synthase CmoA [Gammaproteobacteria bacterium]MDP2346524.1 carboxy-S-adenosyl-L-methionine synthase CmoA [Gammaproteobacteria bacterium]
MNQPTQDNIYASKRPVEDFVFDEKVASVFTDMINRSVPGYATIISMIGMLADRYCAPNSNVYDLGCSLGGATLAMTHHISHKDYRIMAVDNSQAMITRFQATLATEKQHKIDLVCADLTDVDINNASVVVLNFTLQFIPLAQRAALLRKIHDGMNPGGILILSEKIRFADEPLNELLIDMYHRFKEAQGYSQLEISQKRSALEKVLIPETIATHKERIQQAGFSSCDAWFQCFNFASLIAFR